MTQEPITLFPGVEILPTLTKQHTMEYLKRYCTIDDLDDTIYVKKLGNDKTTFAIEFLFDEISVVRKIKDKNGNNVEESIFDNEFDAEDNERDEDENLDETTDDLIVCPECKTKCETEYCYVEADEIHGDEQVPIYSECPKCGWSVC